MKKEYSDKNYEELVKKYDKQILIFGNNVERLRKKNHLTQAELGMNCGVSLRTIQRIENGQMTVRLPIVFALATELGVQLNALFKNI